MTPAEQEQVFIKAIVDNQRDVAARLAYSDWLEEQGRLTKTERVRNTLNCQLLRFNGVVYLLTFPDSIPFYEPYG